MIRVLIADDHKLVRDAYRTLLESDDEIEVVGEAHDGAEAVELAQALTPDIILMDVAMPVLDGLGALKKITSSSKDGSVIMLSMYVDENIVQVALRLGAKGYLAKTDGVREVKSAIRIVNTGESYLSTSVQKMLSHND